MSHSSNSSTADGIALSINGTVNYKQGIWQTTIITSTTTVPSSQETIPTAKEITEIHLKQMHTLRLLSTPGDSSR